MKKAILTIAMFTALGATAQMTVKESVKDSVVWQATKLSSVPQLVQYSLEGTEDYTLFYQNGKYTTLVDINHVSLGSKEDAKQFFDLLYDVCLTGKEYTIELDGKTWFISKAVNYALVWSEYTQFALTKKQLESVREKL
jgi:hypothetical protein